MLKEEYSKELNRINEQLILYQTKDKIYRDSNSIKFRSARRAGLSLLAKKAELLLSYCENS